MARIPLEHYAAAKVRPSTLASYRAMVDLYVIPSIGRIPLAQLQPEHVQAMLSTIADKGRRGRLSDTTVRYCYSVLRIALGRAVMLGRAHRDVATLIDPPVRTRREVQPISAEQARAFLASVSGDRLEPLYRLAIATRLRQGELLALRWSDVDLNAGQLVVRHTLQRGTRDLAEPKTDRARRFVGLDGATVAMLREYRASRATLPIATAFLFATPAGRPLDARNVLRAFHKALSSAGLTRQPFHQLRHACATLLLEDGEELANISKMLGHADLSTTANLYAHLTPAMARKAADRMGTILAG